MPYYTPRRPQIMENEVLLYYMTFTLAPASLAGGGLLIHENINARQEPRKAWVYSANEKRVRRLPSLSYDMANFNSESIRVVDEVDLFNGAPDRYEWTLIGKKNMIVPYNSEQLSELLKAPEPLLKPYHLPSSALRFEMHRVWVLEGELRPGMRHAYKKRRLYIDEDSWIALMADQFDQQGRLWRTSLSFTKYRDSLPGVWKVADVFFDLKSQNYFIQAVAGSGDEGVIFSDEPQDRGFFSPAALRRQSVR